MSLKSYHTWASLMSGAAMVWIVPAALLMTFGERPEQAGIDPAASLVSGTPDCVMFCAGYSVSVPAAVPRSEEPTAGEQRPGCAFLCEEPPLPSNEELCRLFCELGQGW